MKDGIQHRKINIIIFQWLWHIEIDTQQSVIQSIMILRHIDYIELNWTWYGGVSYIEWCKFFSMVPNEKKNINPGDKNQNKKKKRFYCVYQWFYSIMLITDNNV